MTIDNQAVLDDLSTKTTLVVGASQGLGRGIACALADAGAPVIAVARSGSALAELTATHPTIKTVVADATDAVVADRLLDRYDPTVLVLAAGARALPQALPHHTWDTFSVNWHSDVKIAFHWLRAALLRPLPPGSRVIVISSGAALAGSPLSGGYAGAKATQRLITGYARDEAGRAGLDITFATVLPRITAQTELGRPFVQAYAARNGQTEADYLRPFGPPLTPEVAGATFVGLIRADVATVAPEYLLTGAGLEVLLTR